MPRWRFLVVVLASLVVAVAGTVLAVAINVATGGSALWFPFVERHPLWWTAGATVAVAGGGLLAWWSQRWLDRGLNELIPPREQLESSIVDRPAEVNQIVAGLWRRRSGGTVQITTAAHGVGGFGKTTVARMVRADRRVLRMFRGRVYWVTVGRDAGKEAMTGLVNGLIAQLESGRAVTFTDTRQASDYLGALLAKGPRRLLVLDDVWSDEQAAVFPAARRCARLVTTRNQSLASTDSRPVKIDQMSPAQARALLQAGLPLIPPRLTQDLLEVTGRWPLLLRLVSTAPELR
jgi:NB-ARC domain